MYIIKNSKIPSLVPSRSVLALCPREVWERAGERTPSQYWQNTPHFSTFLPWSHFTCFYSCVLGEYLSVTSQLTAESRIDLAENA